MTAKPLPVVIVDTREQNPLQFRTLPSIPGTLSGSYVLVSVARSVLVMQPASDDTEDNRVVVTCAKNNDGQLGPRTAWARRDGLLFEPEDPFDWEGFDGGAVKREAKVSEEHLLELFEDGRRRMSLKQAAERLEEIAKVGRSTAYEALKLTGRFGGLLVRDSETELLGLRPEADNTEAEEGQ